MILTIEDLCTVIVDCEHKTSPIDADGQFFAVGTPAMRGNIIDFSQARRISQSTYASWTRRLTPRAGDLLFAREAPVGPIVLIPDSENIAPGQRTMLMRPDPSLADSRFFYYLLSSPAQQDRLQSLAGGSTVAHLNVADVRRFPLDVPSLGDQRAIVDVLGALDDKIAVNMRLVLTSVNLAAAIFDQSLSQPKLRNVSLDTIAGNIPGRYLARENYDGGDYFVYGSNSVMGRHSAAIHAGGFSVLAKIGSYCGNVRWTQRPAWVNNNASAIVPSAGTDPWILRQVVSRIDMGPHKAGTGQPYIRMGSLFASHVDLPGRQECAFIGPRLKALAEAECMAEEENVALTATRDALIPKLMSGKLRVRDAEKLLAGVL